MKKKIIILLIAAVAIITPFFLILEHSAFKAGFYLGFAIIATALAGRIIFRKEISNAK